jgi:hypothetical protein
VTHNRNVQSTKVRQSLETLNKATKEYREPRNLYLHRGRLPELEALDRYESFRFLQRSGAEFGKESEPFLNAVDRIYEFERRNLIKIVQTETARIASELRQLFDALYPIYSSTWKRLK